jgi:hypothetical protein
VARSHWHGMCATLTSGLLVDVQPRSDPRLMWRNPSGVSVGAEFTGLLSTKPVVTGPAMVTLSFIAFRVLATLAPAVRTPASVPRRRRA